VLRYPWFSGHLVKTSRKATREFGVDQSTWLDWEHTGYVAWKRSRQKFEALFTELRP
jgi:hypothetical protein